MLRPTRSEGNYAGLSLPASLTWKRQRVARETEFPLDHEPAASTSLVVFLQNTLPVTGDRLFIDASHGGRFFYA